MKTPYMQAREYLPININQYSLDGYDYTIFLKTLHFKFAKGMRFDGTEIVVFGTINNEYERKFYFTSIRDINEEFIPLQNEIELLKEFFVIHYGL